MINIYGIKNCDTVQKALKWLDANKVSYQFHNYKETGLDKATIQTWLKHLPADKLINSRSTTYKDLPAAEKEKVSSEAGAIALIMEHTSIVKRPVWDFGKGNYLLGWDEKVIREHIL
jgi:arsenate reductase